jgi:hypothetical protein
VAGLVTADDHRAALVEAVHHLRGLPRIDGDLVVGAHAVVVHPATGHRAFVLHLVRLVADDRFMDGFAVVAEPERHRLALGDRDGFWAVRHVVGHRDVDDPAVVRVLARRTGVVSTGDHHDGGSQHCCAERERASGSHEVLLVSS